MGKETLLDKIRGFIYSVEYWFAKRWLDRQFGVQEYWGDYISRLRSKDSDHI